MTFHEALATQPGWVQAWVLWLNIVSLGTVAVMALNRRTWAIAGAIFVINIPMVIAMRAVYEEVGYTRLLGLPHLVFWTPLLVWLVLRLRAERLPGPWRQVAWVYAASIAVSLAFDAADVARYLAGERASLVPAV